MPVYFFSGYEYPKKKVEKLDPPAPLPRFCPLCAGVLDRRQGLVREFAGALHATAALDGVVPFEYHSPTPGTLYRAFSPPVVETISGAHLEGVEIDPAPG